MKCSPRIGKVPTDMLYVASLLLTGLYVVLPILALAWRCFETWLTGSRKPLWSMGGVVLWGLLIGIGLTLAFAHAATARAPISQMLLTAYFAMGALLILRGFNGVLSRLSRSVRPRSMVSAYLLAVVFSMGRVLLLAAIGLPYVMSTLMVYRPKVTPLDSPTVQMGVEYRRVMFEATDGTPIVGWWIPSTADNDRAASTVLVAHGLGANKSNHLLLARGPIAAGYNVLAIDLRAHGESGGQMSTFGDRERHDVLGAVQWLMAAQPERSMQIFGLGASMGAAAIVAAAADDSVEGQHIDAVAVYGTFDDLGKLADSVMYDTFPTPLNWLLRNIGVPIASLHTGRDLTDFAPAELAQQLWPRPLLVIHGTDDEIIRFEHGQSLYLQALQPKQFHWIQRGSHNSIADDAGAAQAVIDFFDNARRIL